MIKTITPGRALLGAALRAPLASRPTVLTAFSQTPTIAPLQLRKRLSLGSFPAAQSHGLYSVHYRDFGTVGPSLQSRQGFEPRKEAETPSDPHANKVNSVFSKVEGEGSPKTESTDTGLDATIQFKYLTLRQLAVLLALMGLAFTGSAVASRLSNEELLRLLYGDSPDFLNSLFVHLQKTFDAIDGFLTNAQGVQQATEMRAAWRHEMARKLGIYYKSLMSSISGYSKETQEFCSRTFLELEEWYLELPAAKAALLPVLAINAAVFLAWKIPPLRTLMNKHFIDVAGKGKIHTMITATFSHQTLVHFIFNQVAMWSFCAYAMDPVVIFPTRESMFYERSPYEAQLASLSPPEADLGPQFLGFFICAGLLSSLVSRAHFSLRFLRTRMAASSIHQSGASWHQINTALRAMAGSGSLGSSGSLYGILALTALVHPDSRIGILFVPGFTMRMQDGFFTMLCIDVLGILAGWRWLDHAGHLGGALFGFWWYYQGSKWWIWCRTNLLKSKQPMPASVSEPAKAEAEVPPKLRLV